MAGYLILFENGRAAGLWVIWGVLTLVFSRVGSVTPIDETPVDSRRRAIGTLTLVLGLLCFTPVPIALVG
jgi:hypothetical protein